MNYYTDKHLFDQMPNDSAICRWCKRSQSDDLHSNVPTRKHDCIDAQGQPTGLFCVACVEERDESKQADQTATTTADECAYVYRETGHRRCGRSRRQHATVALSHNFIDPSGPVTLSQPAPNTGEWCYIETPYSAEIAIDGNIDNLRLRAHWTGLGDIEILRATMRQIVSDHNRIHQTATPAADNWRIDGKFVSDCEQTLSGMYAVYDEDDRFIAAFSKREEAQRVVDEHSAVAKLTAAIEALRQRHREKAIRCNFDDCGCEDCLALDQTLTTLRNGSVRE
jgi:hypothetical protein